MHCDVFSRGRVRGVICKLYSSNVDEDTASRLWLQLQQNTIVLQLSVSHSNIIATLVQHSRQTIHTRYIRGKPNGKLIWKSIQNGPTPHPMVTDPPPTGSTIVPAPRKKLDSEFNDEENKLEMADTQAKIILSQGLPRHIFNILNQTSTTQEIWNNVELLMQGSGRTLQQRKEDLFDEYERFRAIGNESIHDYFVRFHKLVNDMKITQLEIPTHQMNTKFVNNLPAYWGKYVTNVKQNMDISTTPYVQIYTHLKAYEPHAKKTLKKQEQSTSIVDPLAYVAHTTSAPALSSPSTPSPQPTAQSPNDALMATMTQIANLLSGFQKQFPPTNNQLRTSSNSRTHATVHDGHIVTEPKESDGFNSGNCSSCIASTNFHLLRRGETFLGVPLEDKETSKQHVC
ncbi:hypothetical protein Tco_1313644 [Tanacetum coccineum]